MAERKGSGCMIIVAGAAVLTGIVMVWPTDNTPPTKTPVEVTKPAVPEKPGVPYLIIKSGEPFPTQHLVPPTELHVSGVSAEECAKMGGTYQAPSASRGSICLDVDY